MVTIRRDAAGWPHAIARRLREWLGRSTAAGSEPTTLPQRWGDTVPMVWSDAAPAWRAHGRPIDADAAAAADAMPARQG